MTASPIPSAPGPCSGCSGSGSLILDGAMGTMIQRRRLTETEFRGERFADWPVDLAGNNDLLTLTQPQVIAQIHREYLDAGADVITTNTFNSTAISQADYRLQHLAPELNLAAARLARETADEAARRSGRERFVAGALGPTSRTASLSPDVNDPAYRNVDFDELAGAYADAVRGLVAGGVDAILIETIFDTLNAKAALFAVRETLDELGVDLPIIVSGTITDASGRTLSGQTTEAFWNSIRHAKPAVVGLNCALGGKQLRPYIEELSRIADTFVCAYPNAGLPNAFGEYDETSCETAEVLREFAVSGFVNMVGGCCGTTPEHIREVAEAVTGLEPRRIPCIARACRLSGLEPLTIDAASLFVNAGERTNVTGSAKFRKLIEAGDYAAAVDIARQQVANGAQLIDINMDEGMLDSQAAMVRLLAADRRRAGRGARSGDARLVQMVGDRGGPQVRSGKIDRQFDQPQGRRGDIPRARAQGDALRRRGGGHGLRREGPGGYRGAQGGDLRACV